jgi:hypothetical protein
LARAVAVFRDNAVALVNSQRRLIEQAQRLIKMSDRLDARDIA